jgi:hypothetical protein
MNYYPILQQQNEQSFWLNKTNGSYLRKNATFAR